MRILVKIFLLMLAFSVEVRVKAQHLSVTSSCSLSRLGAGLDCAALNGDSPLEKDFKNLQVFLSPHAVFSLDQSTLKWVRGSGAVRSQDSVQVRTSFGSAVCEKDCLGAFDKKNDHLVFHALKGDWQVLSFAGKDRTPLPAGESVKLYLVGVNGISDWEVPFTLSRRELGALLTEIFPKSRSKEEAREVTELWKKAVERLSVRYQDQAQRQVASHRERLDQQKRAREKQRAEERALRELFRRKNLLD